MWNLIDFIVSLTLVVVGGGFVLAGLLGGWGFGLSPDNEIVYLIRGTAIIALFLMGQAGIR